MIINLIRLLINLLIIILWSPLYQVMGISKREPPRVSTTLVTNQPITYWIGSAVRLRCPIEEIVDHRSAFIEWKRNNVPVEFLAGYTVTLDGELAIDFARPTDSGTYTCRAINGFGSIVVNVSIVITGSNENLIYILDRDHDRGHVDESKVARSQNVPKTPPEIAIPRPEVIKRLPSQSIELKCPTKNTNATQKASKVRWFKDGRLLVVRRSKISRIKIRGRRLSLNYIDYNDYGTYHCTSGETSEILKVFKVTLNDRIRDSALRNIDMIRVHPEEKIVKIGQDVTFECDYRTEFQMKYDIKWLKNCSKEEALARAFGEKPLEIDGLYYKVLDVPIEIGYPDEAYYFFNISLKIKNVKIRDSGYYACLLNHGDSQFYGFGALNVVPTDEEDYLSQMIAEDLLVEISPDNQEQISSNMDIFLVSGLSTTLFIFIFIGLWYVFVRKSCIERLSADRPPKDQPPQQTIEHSSKMEC